MSEILFYIRLDQYRGNQLESHLPLAYGRSENTAIYHALDGFVSSRSSFPIIFVEETLDNKVSLLAKGTELTVFQKALLGRLAKNNVELSYDSKMWVPKALGIRSDAHTTLLEQGMRVEEICAAERKDCGRWYERAIYHLQEPPAQAEPMTMGQKNHSFLEK